MEALEEVKRLYEAYEEQFHQQELARKPGAGMFGLGMGPKDYPCHNQFAQDLEALLQEIEGRQPDSAQTRELLEYIYTAPQARHKNQDAVYWMMLAVHSLTVALIQRLAPSDAQALYDICWGIYPRRGRLPAQDKVLSALKGRTK